MVRISSLPDLSRFVKRVDKIPVYNTVHLLIGEDSVEVSGCVMSQASQMLEELVGAQRELYLDQFTGELEGIQDVVEILYGGEIELTGGNIKTVLKFSVLYKVEEMLALCSEWLKRNISTDNLLGFIQFGILVERIGHGEAAVLDICTEFIKENVKDELLEIIKGWNIASGSSSHVSKGWNIASGSSSHVSKGWNIASGSSSHVSVLIFLIQEEILYYSLPLLTAMVTTDADVLIVLCQLEDKEVVEKLWEFGDRSVEMLEVMREKVESLETYKQLTRVQAVYSKSLISNSKLVSKYSSKNIVRGLLSGDYRLFSVERMLGLEKEFSISHFQFVDIVLEWVAANKPSQNNITELWGKVRHEELCLDYLYCARNVIISSGKVTLPAIDDGLEFKFMFDETILSKSQDLAKIEFVAIFEGWILRKVCSFTIKLRDSIPCWELKIYENDNNLCVQLEHVFLNFENGIHGYGYFSLLTNSYSSVIEKIKECWDSNTKIYLSCIYKCTDGK